MDLIIRLLRIYSECVAIIFSAHQNTFLDASCVFVDFDFNFDQRGDSNIEDISDSRKPSVGPATDIVYPQRSCGPDDLAKLFFVNGVAPLRKEPD